MDLIQLRQGQLVIMIHGAAASAPFRGGRLAGPTAPPGRDGLVEEQVELVLEGDPAEIDAAAARLSALLAEAERQNGTAGSKGAPAADGCYLEARPRPGLPTWRSPICGGWVELLGAGLYDRARRSQGLRLRITRPDWWEEAEPRPVPLSNPNGQRVTAGLAVANHTDSGTGHANWAAVSAADTSGDLPTPLWLELAVQSQNPLGAVHVGQALSTAPSLLQNMLEFESGLVSGAASAAIQSDPGYSGGAVLSLSWTGANDIYAWRAALSGDLLASAAGRPFLPAVSVASLPNETIWHHWSIQTSGPSSTILMESRGGVVGPRSGWFDGAPVFLPPWPVDPGAAPAGLDLVLCLRAEGSGAHSLALDALCLLPLDGWRIYRVSTASPYVTTLVDDPWRGLTRGGPPWIQSHAPEGPGLALVPGRDQCFTFLFSGQSFAYPADTTALVRMQYRPRRRVL